MNLQVLYGQSKMFTTKQIVLIALIRKVQRTLMIKMVSKTLYFKYMNITIYSHSQLPAILNPIKMSIF